MTNDKIQDAVPERNAASHQIVHERAVFIVPTKDCLHQEDYTQVKIDGWDKYHLQQLTRIEIQVIMLLFDDIEVDKLESYLTELHIKPVEQILAELQVKVGVQTTHGLVSRLYRMGLHKLMNEEVPPSSMKRGL